MATFVYYKNMIAGVPLIAFLINGYFTPEWQRNVRDITREIVAAMLEERGFCLSWETPLFQYISSSRFKHAVI